MLPIAKRTVANILFGGSNLTIALLPLSVKEQASINVSLGVCGLILAFVS
ncbi:DUF992 domain-containing protein [Bradyrhizobium sp. 48]|nr:DUF992 domain-containing protein [Bradyrhizobium sp. 48]